MRGGGDELALSAREKEPASDMLTQQAIDAINILTKYGGINTAHVHESLRSHLLNSQSEEIAKFINDEFPSIKTDGLPLSSEGNTYYHCRLLAVTADFKSWILDQTLRILTGADYEEEVYEANCDYDEETGECTPDAYGWDLGIDPSLLLGNPERPSNFEMPNNLTDADLKSHMEQAVGVIFRYGGIDGEHHKQWVIDQALRILSGENYPSIRPTGWEEGGIP